MIIRKKVLFLCFSWMKLCFQFFSGRTYCLNNCNMCQISKTAYSMTINCKIHMETEGMKKWVDNLPLRAITVVVVHTRCMNVVLCMSLWKSKAKLVLREVDTSLTESDASSTPYFQLTEELLNLFYYIDSSSCPCTLCLIILFNWSIVARAKVDLQREGE